MEKYASFLKEVEHARRVRNNILQCLEKVMPLYIMYTMYLIMTGACVICVRAKLLYFAYMYVCLCSSCVGLHCACVCVCVSACAFILQCLEKVSPCACMCACVRVLLRMCG